MKKYKSYNPKSGFKVPENYFREFEAKMMASTDESQDCMDNSNKDSGFKVPQDYFATLEENILAKIEEPTKKGKVVSIFNRRKLYAAAAVAAVFIGIISTLLFKPTPQQTFNSLEISVMEDYIDSEAMEFDYNDISSFIYEEGYVLDILNDSEVSDDAVFDYLNENIEDPSLFIE
jgi:hypothetical protein